MAANHNTNENNEENQRHTTFTFFSKFLPINVLRFDTIEDHSNRVLNKYDSHLKFY